jgi:hypothetical protein
MILRPTVSSLCGVVCVLVSAWSLVAASEEGAPSEDMKELAKKSQNPIASLISLPFENNINYNSGPLNKTDNTLTAKPVYPTQIGENWNLINRALIPLVSRGRRSTDDSRQIGLGDITYQGFFSPAGSGAVTWGVGPTFVARTGSDDLSSDQWSIGPNFVVLATPGKWVFGALAFNIWSFAGDDGAKDISVGNLQYFVNYNMVGGWYLTTAPTITANWKEKNDQTWTIPVGGGFGRVFKFGQQPLNARLAAYYNVERPDNTSDWQISAQLTFLFPK